MPLRMCIANPVALAALAVIAIGYISYQIISKQKKRIPIRERRSIDYPDEDRRGPKTYDNQSGIRKRHNTRIGPEKFGNENTEHEKTDDTRSTPKNKSVEYCEEKHPDCLCNASTEKVGSFNNLNSLNQSKDENDELQNVIRNINQEDTASSIVECTEHVNDFEDGSHSSMDPEIFKGNTVLKDLEERYKKEVRDQLKHDVKNMDLSDCSDRDSNFSENDVSDILQDFNDSFEDPKKQIMCKGCEERFANAVAYPCGLKYLCLDCAIKVHRIYKKCTVCNFQIKSFDI